MKILKKLRKHIVSSPKKLDDTSSILKQLTPITFNSSVHGYNIKISSDGLLAKRNQSFCKAIVFSNRALLYGEEINIVITSISEAWSGSLRFGFSSVNPNNLKNKLPRYMCPDLTNVAGCYARALQDYETEIGTVLTFWLNKFGQIMYKINGQFQGVFLQIDQINVKGPMWAMIDVYGIVTSVKIVNNDNLALNKHKSSSKSMSDINNINSIMTDLNLNDNYFQQRRPQQQTISSLNCDTSPSRQILVSRYYSNIEFNRMQLSETVGANIKLNSSRNIASRKNLTCSQGYVFTKRPLNINEKLVIQILKNDQLYNGNLGFGLTTCNPSKLTSNDLPEDSHKLLERSEYWVVIKDVLMNAKVGDELGFTINNLNQVLLTKNNLPPVILMHIDPTQRFYAFFDLYGKTTKIHVLGTFFEANPMQLTNLINQNLSQNNMSNYYSEINNYNGSVQNHQQSKIKQLNVKKCNINYADKNENKSNTLIYKRSIIDQKKLSNNGECTVCFEKPINCVLYQCGHMCMCYDCALRQWQGVGSGQCPICRAYICDVIRTYWS